MQLFKLCICVVRVKLRSLISCVCVSEWESSSTLCWVLCWSNTGIGWRQHQDVSWHLNEEVSKLDLARHFLVGPSEILVSKTFRKYQHFHCPYLTSVFFYLTNFLRMILRAFSGEKITSFLRLVNNSKNSHCNYCSLLKLLKYYY